MLDPEELLGRSEEEALQFVRRHGFEVAVSRLGGEDSGRWRVVRARLTGPGKVEVLLAGETRGHMETPAVGSPTGPAPRHIAIIMDGNGRWATRRGLPRVAGHAAGVEALKRTVRASAAAGVEVLTVYAFSTENWRRPETEVRALMRLMVRSLRRERPGLVAEGVRLRAIGAVEGLPPEVREEIRLTEEATAANTRILLNLALNYGGRREILHAAREVSRRVAEGLLAPDDITEEVFARHLYTAGLPDPDLVIRPSGEMRLSNFMLWQVAYSEIWYTDVLWPDFDCEVLERAIAEYRRRERRFGGVTGAHPPR